MGRQIEGQMSLFDIHNETEKRKPFEYGFKRYIGQRVMFNRVMFNDALVGEITEIGPYYTTVKTDDGEVLAGTPTTIAPLKTCAGCTHFRDVVSGLGDIYHDTACLKDRPWAKFKKPEDPACKDYKPKEDAQNDN